MAEALSTIDPADWDGLPVPRQEWWLHDLIPSRHVTLLSGDGGVGKSHLALQWCVASALGVRTVGGTPVDGRVFYLGANDEKDEFNLHLARLVEHHGRTLEELQERCLLVPLADHHATFVRTNKNGALIPTAVWHRFKDACLDFAPDLIVLDTNALLSGDSGIKRVQVRQFVSMLRRLAFDCGCAVLLLSHSDTTSWNNSVRSSLRLEYPAGDDVDTAERVLTIEKSNYAASGISFALRLDDGVFVAA